MRIYKSKFRVESDEVQGPGSWVEFQRPTWGMISNIPESDRTGRRLLEVAILDWNWTDDNGDPLPLPKDAPGLLENIPQQESNWLSENAGMTRNAEAQKN